jgi:RNA polymerase sigma-70 factor (ECF subfamily)
MGRDETQPTDAALIQAARTDAGAFRALYDRYAERVYGYHARRTSDAHAAHDLTAETFAQAWLCRTRFRDQAGGSAGPWLFAISRHVVLASVRKRRLEQRACERLGMLHALDRVSVATQPDESWLDGLDEALAQLPEAQRQAIQLHVVEDLDYAQVAQALDTTAGAARVRVSRGLGTLRRLILDSTEAPR